MAVVAALELEHLVAAGVGAHDAEDGEARLGAGVAEADHFDGGHAVDHHLAEDVLELARGAEGGALVNLRLEGVVYLLVGVAADGGAPRADVVDVLVAWKDGMEGGTGSGESGERADIFLFDPRRYFSLLLERVNLALGACESRSFSCSWSV